MIDSSGIHARPGLLLASALARSTPLRVRVRAMNPTALAARIVGVQNGSRWTNVLERSRLNAVV